MVLTLYVLRHAKAEDAAAGGDHERVLRGRGRKTAKVVGRALARLDELPDLVLSSTAARARETAELALEAGGLAVELEQRREVYEASARTLLDQLATLPEEAQRVLLVGHQPGLSLLIAELTGAEPDFPTAACARVDLAVARWKDLAPGTGRLVWLFPADALAALASAQD
ncbi:MAG TPA: histidine phosphatase family protein [Planctomycetota bacterium]